MKKIICVLGCLCAAAFLVSFAGAEPAKPAASEKTNAPEKVSYHKSILEDTKDSDFSKGRSKSTREGLAQKKYLFIYRSASWCGPCRAFTPKLVKFYKENLKNGDFDLIFVSSDESQQEMDAYMKEDKMPWLGVKLKSSLTKKLKETYKTRSIPRLFLIDENDEVIEQGRENVMEKYLELQKKTAGKK